MLRRLLAPLVLGLALTGLSRAEELPLNPYATVTVAPVKTSIYVGSVALAAPAFVRQGSTYGSTYTAKVFPYFFYSEKGRIWIDVSDESLRRLQQGESVEFAGRALNEDGEERRVEGKATPTDAASGRIKVRIFVSKRIELIFNTTYRFGDK